MVGANNDIVDNYYTHVSLDSQREAIEAVSGTATVSPLQQKIDSVLSYINSLPEKHKSPFRVLAIWRCLMFELTRKSDTALSLIVFCNKIKRIF